MADSTASADAEEKTSAPADFHILTQPASASHLIRHPTLRTDDDPRTTGGRLHCMRGKNCRSEICRSAVVQTLRLVSNSSDDAVY